MSTPPAIDTRLLSMFDEDVRLKGQHNASVLSVLIRIHFHDLMKVNLAYLVGTISWIYFVGFFLFEITRTFNGTDGPDGPVIKFGLLLVLLMGVVLMFFMRQTVQIIGLRIGRRVRSACAAAVYRRTLFAPPTFNLHSEDVRWTMRQALHYF